MKNFKKKSNNWANDNKISQGTNGQFEYAISQL